MHDQPTAPVARGKGRAPAVVAADRRPRPPPQPTRPAGKHAPPARQRARPAEAAPPPRGRVAGSAARRGRGLASGGHRRRSAQGRQPARAAARRSPRSGRRAREELAPDLFGKDLISEKSLDEVILAYLSEDASEK